MNHKAASSQCVPPVRPPSASPQCVLPVRPPSASSQCILPVRPPSASPQCVLPVRPPSASPQCVPSRPPSASSQSSPVVLPVVPSASSQCIPPVHPPSASSQCVLPVRPPSASSQCVPSASPQCVLPVCPPSASPQCVLPVRPPSASSQCVPPVPSPQPPVPGPVVLKVPQPQSPGPLPQGPPSPPVPPVPLVPGGVFFIPLLPSHGPRRFSRSGPQRQRQAGKKQQGEPPSLRAPPLVRAPPSSRCLRGYSRWIPPVDTTGPVMDDASLSDLSPANSTQEPGWGASSEGAESVHLAVRCVMTSLYLLIVTVGLLGNITLLKIVITNSAMRSVPNIFISSLAAGDLLLLVTCVPVDAFRYFSEEWLFGEAACKLIPAIQLTSVGVSVFTLTALSADRYKAIVNPMEVQTSSAVFWTCLKAVSIWLLSFLLAVPEAVFSQVVSMQGHSNHSNVTSLNCVPYPLSNQMHPRIHSVLIFLVYFLVPLSIISVFYFHIARTLLQSAKDMPGEESEHGRRQMDTRKRLAKIVLVFVGLFAVCWFPNQVLYLYRSFHYQDPDLSLAHLVLGLLARVLSFSSSCANPYALYLLSHSFRRHFNSQLRCIQGPRLERQASYMQSTSHIRLTSIRKTTPTTAIIASADNGNSSRPEVAL
ncbi:neuromedin-B receptor-like [Pseudoliparis swirei]|uniref:neuromedin-B receptor-like n=1 Tax=Pseudoliparis swirei TaxID=2059687 RepID=UPI0024BE8776|nr:neuromedin-B receptor-like [Pseudoliparis swirei]